MGHCLSKIHVGGAHCDIYYIPYDICLRYHHTWRAWMSHAVMCLASAVKIDIIILHQGNDIPTYVLRITWPRSQQVGHVTHKVWYSLMTTWSYLSHGYGDTSLISPAVFHPECHRDNYLARPKRWQRWGMALSDRIENIHPALLRRVLPPKERKLPK